MRRPSQRRRGGGRVGNKQRRAEQAAARAPVNVQVEAVVKLWEPRLALHLCLFCVGALVDDDLRVDVCGGGRGEKGQ